MRIALIGPTAPDHDPLARYTRLLHQQLSCTHEVRLYSFTRPHRVCPELAGRDFGAASIPECSSLPIIAPLNPITWLKTALRLRTFQPHVILFPWYSLIWAPAFWTVGLLARIMSHAQIVFLCHRVLSRRVHLGAAGILARLCTRAAFTAAHCFIAHTRETQARLAAMLPSARCVHAPYPHRAGITLTGVAPEAAREAMGVAGNVLLFFAFANAHCGLACVLRAMPSILEKIDLTLLVVGALGKKEHEMRALAWQLHVRGSVIFHPRFVPDDQLEPYFAAADLVALPAAPATAADIAHIAYAMRKPVIGPKIPGLCDAIDHGTTGYLVEQDDPAAISDAVADYFACNRAAEMRPYLDQVPAKYSWGNIVRAIELLALEAAASSPQVVPAQDGSVATVSS